MNISLGNNGKIDGYSYVYLFMIMLYAGASTDSLTGLMYFGLSVTGFLVPIVMTVILLFQQKVDFSNRNYWLALTILTIWFTIQFVAKSGRINITLTLFCYYQLTLAFIIIQVFREKFFAVYEDLTYKLCIISLILWMITVIAPYQMASFLHLFKNGRPNFSEGSIGIYSMVTLDQVEGLIRNRGFAWEPGRFACFICLAIYCNLLINGFTIKNNPRIWIFLITLLTTQSTTGVFTLMILMIIFIINRRKRIQYLWIVVLVPAAIYLYSLEFAGEKLNRSIEKTHIVMDYSDKNGYSLDRIESLTVEWYNFIHDPVLGYCETRNSYFENYVASGFYTNNGTMQLLARYGGVLGLLVYLCIYISSKRIAVLFNDRFKISYLILFVCISMAYSFSNIVLIMAFSFWGIFVPRQVLIKNNNV